MGDLASRPDKRESPSIVPDGLEAGDGIRLVPKAKVRHEGRVEARVLDEVDEPGDLAKPELVPEVVLGGDKVGRVAEDAEVGRERGRRCLVVQTAQLPRGEVGIECMLEEGEPDDEVEEVHGALPSCGGGL